MRLFCGHASITSEAHIYIYRIDVVAHIPDILNNNFRLMYLKTTANKQSTTYFMRYCDKRKSNMK